jgi:uncharacterized protein (TIGR03437 family)
MLVSCAYAADWTVLNLGYGGLQVGLPARITAAVVSSRSDVVNEGTVAFAMNGLTLPHCAGVPVVGNKADCQILFPRSGEFQISAAYTGTERFGPSSTTATVKVGGPVPAVYIAKFPSEPVYGNNLILNALVQDHYGIPVTTGTFTFSDFNVVIQSETPVRSDGRAGLVKTLNAGPHEIRARYSGNDLWLAAGTPALAFSVAKGTPVVAVSATAAQVGEPIIVSASVTALNPTGTVTFEGVPDCTVVALAAGWARCRTSYPQLGEHAVTARYSGDANLLPGNAPSMVIPVRKAVPSLYAATSASSSVYGQPVLVGALALGAPWLPPPAGPVEFSAENGQTGTASLDREGRGSWVTTFPAGVHRVTAAYAGDGNYAPAMAATSLIVTRANTATTLTTPAGGPFTATVAAVAPGGGYPTGSVRFLRDGEPAGTAPLTGGTATLVAALTGTIAAEYPGDSNFIGSSSSAAAAAPKALVMLSSDRNPGAAAQPIAFTAVVMPGPGTSIPLGSVQFTANGAALGTVTLVAGRATLTVPLAPGQHLIAAAYSGDAVYAAASGSLTQVISGTQAGMGLIASVPSTVFGQPVTFTAQLASGGTGTAQFSDGASLLGSAPLAAGVASLSVATLAAGAHTISASWSGDATYAAASAELPYTVGRAPTATALTLGTGAASVRVVALAPGAGAPAGSVQIVNARTNAPLIAAALASGAATVILPRAGEAVAAVYTGDANFLGSVSAPASAVTAVNAASYAGQTVAPDEIVTLFGPIPAGLQAVKVTDREDETREARVLHSAAGQAAIVLPGGLTMGPAVVAIGDWEALVTVSATAPGLFTADASGRGAPAGLTAPVELGEDGATIVLYGTGIRHAASKPVCTVAGQPVEVLYAGAQGEFPGLDQVNLKLPQTLRGVGPAVLELIVDGVAANLVTLTLR